MSDTSLDHPASSRSLAWGLLILLAWFLRKPLLGLTALLLHAAAALVLPTLVALGVAKAWQLTQARIGTRELASPVYAGDSESLTTRAADMAPAAVI